jgi:transcriptional regulator with XRE-family HTH domain
LATNKTQKDVAEALEWSASKVLRIEAGASNIGTTDLRVLLALYDVDDPIRVDEFVNMGRAARQRTWRDQYRPHVDPQFFAFLEYEAAALRIHQFQSMAMPGLLQTEDYIRELSKPFYTDPERLERGIKIRLSRQDLLDRADSPELVFLLDESALRHQVGGGEIMRQQLMKLLELGHRSNITIQVVPFSAGHHFGTRGSFVVFELSDDAEDRVVFLEEPTRDVLIRDEPSELELYAFGFIDIRESALSVSDSEILITRILNEIDASDV